MASIIPRFITRSVSPKPGLFVGSTLQLESSSLLGSSGCTWCSFLFTFSTPTSTAPQQIMSATPQPSHFLSWCWKGVVSGRSRCWSRSFRTFTTSNGPESEADRAVGDGGDNRAQEPLAAHKGCTCWKCDSPVPCRDFVCKCGVPQLLEGRFDYFELLGCPRSVFVEAKLLEMNFKNMQRAFHPDLFATRSADERDVSSINSTMANKAYQTLAHPMQRVKYLMRLLGSSVLEESDEGSSLVPPEFLMEVMDTRERLEHCCSVQEAESVLATTNTAIQECLRTMDSVLKAGGGKHELATPAIRLRYYYRIEEEARNMMHQLEDMGSSHSGR